jgi:hypothetical protein
MTFGQSPSSATPFLVIGAMKSGTTSLTRLLSDHPNIELVAEKESSSFLDYHRAESTARTIRASSALAAGEISTAYMQNPMVHCDPRLAFRSLGSDLKIIAILREPLSRAFSHWRHWAQLGRNPEGSPSEHLANPESPYVQFSLYHRQLLPWLSTFGESNLLTLRLEDYSIDQYLWTERLSEFLHVPHEGFEQTAIRKENTAETRIVTGGLGARFARSTAYRQVVRPLAPPKIRRLGSLMLGGKQGGYESISITPATRANFSAIIAEDQHALKEQWPHLHWAVERH